MANQRWINSFYRPEALFLTAFFLVSFLVSGCASHIDKVIPKNLPTMKQVYESKAGNGGAQQLGQREADIRARPIASGENYVSDEPPTAAQIEHLFPALPNPELYMYVKPHVVGSSGAAVPAYMTRFTMYDRTHYAMPNEIISHIKHPGTLIDPTTKKTSNNNTKEISSDSAFSASTLKNQPHGD